MGFIVSYLINYKSLCEIVEVTEKFFLDILIMESNHLYLDDCL